MACFSYIGSGLIYLVINIFQNRVQINCKEHVKHANKDVANKSASWKGGVYFLMGLSL